MIQSISIENYRGIRKGELLDLPRIAILTGPNGCGKSSVLEAVQIGSVGDASSGVARRDEIPNQFRWLFHRGEASQASIGIHWSSGAALTRKLQIQGASLGLTADSLVKADRVKEEAIFVEQRVGRPRQSLHKLFSETRRRGGVDAACALLSEVDSTIRGLEILTEGDTPVLYIDYEDRVVPAALSGDGMESLVRLALELSQRKQGVFLVEEPEAHQHSAAILRSAKIIVAAARLGSQVILSTHSMELLDDLLAALRAEELDLLAVYRLRLVHGELKVLRMPGKEVNAARTEIEDDLR